MKKLILTAILPMLLILSLAFASALCTKSTDDYGVEVVLNKPEIDYNLNLLNTAENVNINNREYILKSTYSPSLALILRQESDLTCGESSGLSVRLQIPVKAEEKILPYYSFILTSIKGKLNISDGTYNGWRMSCIQGNPMPQCEFRKGETKLVASSVSAGKYDISIETYENLKPCALCDGKCIDIGGLRCIDKNFKQDLTDIIKHSGLANSFDEASTSIRTLSAGKSAIIDLTPETSEIIEWGIAVKRELEMLRLNNILLITNQDIDEISILAEQGAAGENSRIIYCADKSNNEKWIYANQAKFPALTSLRNCREFPLSVIPAGSLSFSSSIPIPAYYLVPMIIAAFLLILFLFLAAVARSIDKRSRKKAQAEI